MSRPVAPVSYQSLKAWLYTYDRRDPLSGDAYIASHVWDSDNYKTEIFGESPIGDNVQARLQTFFDRDPASWSDKPRTRKAKWIEIVGGIGLKGDRPAWLDTLCKRLKLRSTVFDRAREGRQSQVRNTLDVTTVVRYGHVAHVRYDFDFKKYDFDFTNNRVPDWVDLDVFVLPTNEIITVYAQRSATRDSSPLMADLHEPPCPPLQELVNAATILWRFEILLTEIVETRLKWLQEDQDKTIVALKQEIMDPEVLVNILHINNKINRTVKNPLEQINNICRYLVDNQGIYAWLETDLKAEFERHSQDTQHILRDIQESRSIQESYQCPLEIVQAGNSRRTAQRQESIAAERAQSAVVLNRLLAVFTACTVIVVPFTMTAAFFSMQKFADTPDLSIHKFKIIVGSATGAILVAGFLLTHLLRNWRGAVRRLDVSIGYEAWRYRKIHDKLHHLDPFPWTALDDKNGSKLRRAERLETEMEALLGEREKRDRSGDDLDLSRRHWAGDRSGWSALRNRLSSDVGERVSKFGGRVKETLGKEGSSGQASASGSLLPMTGPWHRMTDPLFPMPWPLAGPLDRRFGTAPAPSQTHLPGSSAPSIVSISPSQIPLPASGAPSIVSKSPSQIPLPASRASSRRSTSPSQVLQLASPATLIPSNSQIQGSSASSITPNVRIKESWEAYGC